MLETDNRENQVQLETSRLLLTPITEQDWQLFKDLHESPDVMRYVADPLSEQNIRTRFESRLKEWKPHCSDWLTLTICLKDTNKKIGVTGYFSEWEPYQQAELGFLLNPEYQGKGYAKESTVAVLKHLFKDLGYHKVIATVTEGNAPSLKLLQNIGFQLEGTIRDNYKLNDIWHNDLKLGMLDHEFNEL